MDDTSSFDIDQKVSMVKDMLYTIAKFDGQITEEEHRLIDNVAGDVHRYFTLLAQVTSKETKPTSLERAKLFQARLDIIRKSVQSIQEDMRVTADERELFDAIQQLLPELPSAD